MSLPVPKKNFVGNYVVFFQSLVAMLGSLYFEHFGDLVANIQAGNIFPIDSSNPPCYLCWWSRILLYPIVWFSFIALVRKEPKIVFSILPIALIGMIFSAYQYWFEWVNKEIYVQYLGFITMPALAFVAFLVIFIACMVVKKHIKQYENFNGGIL